MAIVYNKLAPTDGLVLCLDSANRRSYPGTGTLWRDLIESSNQGTLTNGVTHNGQAMKFDGVDDNVKTTMILPNLTPNFSLSVWLYVRSLPANNQITDIFSCAYSAGPQFGFDLRFRNDAGIHKLGLRGGDGISGAELGSDEIYELPTAKWINLIFVITSSGAIAYQNTNQIITYTTMRGVVMNANKPLSIGSLGAYSSPGQELGRYFNGYMDDIRIYNRALTNQEILTLYNVSRRRFL